MDQVHPIDVLCVGAGTYDLVYSVDRHPQPDEKIRANSFIGCGGGPAA
ncbi:MAG: carbohydrate kinase, partial [Desulfobulbaceae bacterium]